MPDRPELSISTTVILLLYLMGWIRAYAKSQDLTLRQVREGSFLLQTWSASGVLMLPYFEMWAVVLIGVMMMFVVDKIFVTCMSMSRARPLTFGDNYAVLMMASCFSSWPILLAMTATWALVAGIALAFIYYMRVQLPRKSDEARFRNGLNLIQVAGLVVGMNVMIAQGFVIQR